MSELSQQVVTPAAPAALLHTSMVCIPQLTCAMPLPDFAGANQPLEPKYNTKFLTVIFPGIQEKNMKMAKTGNPDINRKLLLSQRLPASGHHLCCQCQVHWLLQKPIRF
jgi:hypothetical protein